MKNIFTYDKITKFSSFIGNNQTIAIISHTNPDGDAIGSGLALNLFIEQFYDDQDVRFIVPNRFPNFLNWVDPDHRVHIFTENCAHNDAFIASADVIIIVDMNDTRRLEGMSAALAKNTHAPRILFDHHIDPPLYDLNFHTTSSSSTAFLIFSLIEALGGIFTPAISKALYLGIMTDTGGFSFGNLTPDLFRAAAVLVENGVDVPTINRAVYNTQTESRVRMVGYLLSEKMVVNTEHSAAYITLSRSEKERFNHQIGDTEGLVNIPMTIKGIEFSAILIETIDCIKISLRSTGMVDVNVLARKHFNGGGHKNAAGGKYIGTMDEARGELELLISNLVSAPVEK